MIKKLIKASAGTGKTYRLSMEYLNIILKHQYDPEFSFKNILVITFTRKATAEIRDAVFERLEEILTHQKIDKIQYLENLAGIKLTDSHFDYLKKIHYQMLIAKDQIKISTIDSFISTVFKTMIAPLMNISSYQTQETNPEVIYEKVFEKLMSNHQDQMIVSYLKRLGIRNKKEMIAYLDKMIQYRWLFSFLKNANVGFPDDDELEQAYAEIKTNLISELQPYLEAFCDVMDSKHPGKMANDYLKGDMVRLLNLNAPIQPLYFAKLLSHELENGEILNHHERFKSLLKAIVFWHGGKLKGKACIRLEEAKQVIEDDIKPILAQIFKVKFLIPEQKEIFHFWQIMLDYYDEIKLQEKVFTFDDLLWLSYKNIYNQSNQFIDPNTVMVNNDFYEALCMNIQYMLIDEFQDTSVMQFKIFQPILEELMSGAGKFSETGIIIVGDEKQSIYEWRGGERNLLLQMKKHLRLNDKEVEDLNVCFRSYPDIIQLINELFHPDLYQYLFTDDNLCWEYDASIRSSAPEKPSAVMKLYYTYSSLTRSNNISFDESDDSDEEEESDDDRDLPHTKMNSYKEFVEKMIIPNLDMEHLKEFVVIARTNADLIQIENELNQHNIPTVRQSASSLFEHDAVKCVLALLRFIAYDDWKSLLIFLRSDLILADAEEIASIADQVHLFYTDQICAEDLMKMMMEKDYFVEIQKIKDFWQNLLRINAPARLNDLLNLIIEEFQVTRLFDSENELKNIWRFMELAKQFDMSPAPYTWTLDGFLIFCSDLIKEKSEKQAGVRIDNALELLTIHKSKGLTYHSAFVYLNVGKRKNEGSGLYFYQFDQNEVGKLKYSMISNQYRSTLLKLDDELNNLIMQKVYIEELNNTYVALTRAVQNLGIFIAATYSKDKNMTTSDSPLSILTCRLFLDSEGGMTNQSEPGKKYFIDYVEKQPQTSASFTFKGAELLRKRVAFTKENRLSNEQETAIKECLQEKSLRFLNDRSALNGSIVHDYLSFIYRDSAEERDYAKKRCLQNYANLLSFTEIQNLIDQCNQFLDSNNACYSGRWDHIYNEYTIYKGDKAYRIDRMMMSEKEKLIMIIDYKTGHFKDEQILNYKEIVSQLPDVKSKGYTIQTVFLQVILEK